MSFCIFYKNKSGRRCSCDIEADCMWRAAEEFYLIHPYSSIISIKER